MSATDLIPTLETVRLSLADKVATVTLNRPDKANAMNWQMWQDIRSAMQWADRTPEVRAVVLQGEGKHFTSGIDLTMMMGLQGQIQDDCDGRMREKLRALILELQDTLTSLERCRKPVLAAIHTGCVGGGVDLVSCADMRYCSADAYFTIKEIDIGMVADVGTLQRLPKLIGNQGIVREMAYTGRRVEATEAREIGPVSSVGRPDHGECEAMRASPESTTSVTPSIVTLVSATFVDRITFLRLAGRTARSCSSGDRSP